MAYRAPYDALAMLQFFATRQINGLEVVSAAPQHLRLSDSLREDFPWGDGLRVPGTLDDFELAVRAVLGQQITVTGARTPTALIQTQQDAI